MVSVAGGADADIDYLFAQVGIGESRVEWGSNCGNCATAIALYAVSRGLVELTPGTTLVRMRNLNTGTRLDARVATEGGTVPMAGDAHVPGTLAPGVPVTLAFVGAAGASTGATLPTGLAREELLVQGGRYVVSLIDAGAPMVLVDAGSLGLTGTEDPRELAPVVPLLTEIRGAAAVRMGLRAPGDPVDHAIPKVGIVGPAKDFTTTGGQHIAGNEYDVSVRTLSMHAPHPAIGLTSAVGVATAAATAGTVVENVIGTPLATTADGAARLRIGTAAGVIGTAATLDESGSPATVGLERAARIISESVIFTANPEFASAPVN